MAGGAQEEANRKTVLAFYEKGLNQRTPMQPSPMSATATSSTIQTRPMVRTDSESSLASCAKFPNSHSEIKRSFVDGDYVILHVHAVREPGSRGNAIVDIFKLENGKVVEHWDVVQPIPENPANNNTMF